MRVDIDAIDKALEAIRKVDDRGHQPDMRLGCFRSLRIDGMEVDDTENPICTACLRQYDTCAIYLRGYEVKKEPPKRQRV